ncbi:MAG: radical SAM protein [Defluviitaleaceae bacterium]|nr:radical SAM protein [Defluviitaleaceae bacterium]
MKKSMFLNVIKGENEYLLHNTLYGTMLKAQCDITKAIADYVENESTIEYDESNDFHKALKDLKMIVENNVNEVSLINYHFSEKNEDNLIIIPIVTRQCNFRCVYCYESHENKRIEEDTYENLLNAIRKEIKAKKYKSVTISFFGGEPMLEFEAICNFMQNMKELAEEMEIDLYGAMTTNGYLLSIDKLSKLIELNIIDYQITIDGLKETHDNNRFLVGGQGTWDRIIQNLKDAKSTELSFRVSIRTNFDMDVAHNLTEFFQFVSEVFSGDDRFGVYFETVKKLGGELDDELNVCDDGTKVVNDMLCVADDLNLDLKSFNYTIAPFGWRCYASKNNSLVIDTDGTLLKCTVHLDLPGNCVGELTADGFQIKDDKICKWTSYNLPQKCYKCEILSICFGKRCPISLVGQNDSCESSARTYESVMKAVYKIS